jgi:hypothetical protein
MNSNISDRWQKINGHYVPGRKYSAIKYNANRRGIDFDVSIDHLDKIWEEQQGRCYYTDIELDITSRNNATASLDRRDSTQGYIEGNVIWVDKDVNYCKYTLTEERFLQLVEKIYLHKVRGEEVNKFE